ncbi:hypothetical protein TNCV_1322941 [Trichonephila clavipes]|nr:hypothetical protein TNCV_1322941 [Trichonephila clavipes]
MVNGEDKVMVGILDNETAHHKAKQGADSSQLEAPLTLRRAKSIISTNIDKYTVVAQNKVLWKGMGNSVPRGSNPRYLERKVVVARMCLTTGHDFGSTHPLAWSGC